MLIIPALASSPFLPIKDANIVCDGNSITAIAGAQGNGATSWGGNLSDPFPVQLKAAMQPNNPGLTVANYGVGGQNTSAMIADAATQIDPLISNTRSNILTMWEITNQAFGSSTVQQIYDLTVQYCQARKAAGWAVIVFTAVPRELNLNGRTIAEYNQRMNDVNTLIRNNWRSWANALFDVRALPEFATMNSTYFLPDKIHLSSAGHTVLTASLIPFLSRIPRRR